jgi:type II secretory pathway pseudopilin PulG
MLVKKIKGFTLVELMIVMAILIMMAIILIGILNPIALVNKARDGRRKKDLNRIRVAFEEYYNDKGCYPDATLRDELNDPSSCGTSVFGKWLYPWPCDPKGQPYEIKTSDDPCPKWFKIMATLENKSDPSINVAAQGENDPNYAVSSGNIKAGGYIGDDNPTCNFNGICYKFTFLETEQCNDIGAFCEGSNCYARAGCLPECQVSCCGAGCP